MQFVFLVLGAFICVVCIYWPPTITPSAQLKYSFFTKCVIGFPPLSATKTICLRYGMLGKDGTVKFQKQQFESACGMQHSEHQPRYSQIANSKILKSQISQTRHAWKIQGRPFSRERRRWQHAAQGAECLELP